MPVGAGVAVAGAAEGAAIAGTVAVAGEAAVAASGIAAGMEAASIAGTAWGAGELAAGTSLIGDTLGAGSAWAGMEGASGAMSALGDTASEWASGTPGAMVSNTGLVAQNSPSWASWLKDNKEALKLGGDTLKGIGSANENEKNRDALMARSRLAAQAPIDQYMAIRQAASSSIPGSAIPFSPTGAVLTRQDGTPVYANGTGIVANALRR